MSHWSKICLTGALVFLFLCLPASCFGNLIFIPFTICAGFLTTFLIIVIWDASEDI